MTDSFISADLAVAPNPLGLISSLKLVTIPVDAYTAFEIWVPMENAVLIPEEAMMLIDDRPRLEEICGKLTWLLGATLVVGETASVRELIYDWGSLVNLLHQSNKRFDTITVSYSPSAICANEVKDGMLSAWIIHPSTWHISFWQLNPIARGFQSTLLPISLSITYGESISKRVEATTSSMRYA